MKKRTVFIMATALVIVLVSFVGAILWDGDGGTSPVTDQLSGSALRRDRSQYGNGNTAPI